MFALAGALGAAPPATSPEAIYLRAQTAWLQHVYPSHLSYVIAVSALDRGVRKTQHYDAFYTRSTDAVETHAISREEENAAPPAGSKLFGGVVSHGHLLTRQINATTSDVLGVPILAPNYSFGIVAPPAPPPDDPATTVNVLPEIGRVSVSRARYRITLAGHAPIDGRDAYHLALVPLTDPRRYRLRDLWIDTQTFDVLQLRVAGNFTAKATESVSWTVSFAQSGDGWYIASETAEAPVAVARGHVYDDVTIRFESLMPASAPVLHLFSGGSAIIDLREP